MIKKTIDPQMESSVAMSLEAVEALSPTTAKHKLLSVLLQHALEGDLRSAKLYLEYAFKENLERESGLTLEQAIEMMSSRDKKESGDNDIC